MDVGSRWRCILVSGLLFVLPATFVAAQQPSVETASESKSDSEKKSSEEKANEELRRRLASPRATMRTFYNATSEREKELAVQCLELDDKSITSDARMTFGWTHAWKLRDLLDRIVDIPSRYQDIPDDEATNPWRLNYIAYSMDDGDISDVAEIMIAPSDSDGLWRFTAETVAVIDELHSRWLEREIVARDAARAELAPIQYRIQQLFPVSQHQTHFLIPNYQWVCLVVLIFLGFATDLLTRQTLNYVSQIWFKYWKSEPMPARKRFWKPVGLFAQAMVWYLGTLAVGLPPLALSVMLVILKLFAILSAVWMAFHFIDLFSQAIARRAAATESKFDDLLVPLISKTLKAVAVCAGILQCAQAFELPVVGLVGGLSIGGAALALASKDAVSNLFGSVTVLIDRPFEVGDWIITEDAEGSVESVGFRSSRIRTFYNSLITLPNSRLTTAVVDNMGRRRYRRIKTVLGLQYDTTPDQIDAFCEGVRELIRRHPYTRKDYYHVYFNELGPHSMDVLLYCFVECPDWSVELREKHRLLLDIAKLAQALGVQFAFPTQTVHLYQESGAAPAGPLEDPQRMGQKAAARIAGKFDPTSVPDRVPFDGPTEFGPADLDDGD